MKIHCVHSELVPVETLKPHPKNRNVHPPEQIERLAKILAYQGVRAPIVVSNLSKCMVKGHGTLMAIKKNGWTQAPVVYQDFEDEAQEYAFVQSDNAVASWAELDLSGINSDLGELGPEFDVDLLGIKDFEIEVADKFQGDPDEIPEVPEEPKTKLGDIYQLGAHRLMCGDSTSIDAVERLMNGELANMVWTDPPYGMNLDTQYSKAGWKAQGGKPDSRGRDYSKIIGDDQDFDPCIVLGYFDYCKEIFLWGADHYYWALPKGGAWIIWDKRRSDNFEVKETVDNIFGSHFEACWTKQKHRREIYRIYRVFGASEGVGEERHKGGTAIHYHPTQKPTALFERVCKDIQAHLVVDLFGGSGSTLIACEKTNRKCFMMELHPKYCDVIVARWEKYTGKNAELLTSDLQTV